MSTRELPETEWEGVALAIEFAADTAVEMFGRTAESDRMLEVAKVLRG